MIYQLYEKKGYTDKKIDIFYGLDGTICEVDGNQIETWKQLPSRKWIKQHPDWVPGQVVHRKQGLKMLMEPAPQAPLPASLLCIQEDTDQDSSKQIATKPSSLNQQQQIPVRKPYQSQHRHERQHNRNPSQSHFRQQKRFDQWDQWQGH